jgi:hypothetical protein
VVHSQVGVVFKEEKPWFAGIYITLAVLFYATEELTSLSSKSSRSKYAAKQYFLAYCESVFAKHHMNTLGNFNARVSREYSFKPTISNQILCP